MAYTFRGVGVMNYGMRGFRADGSYITTLWFVCLYIPIVPIRSKRVRPTGMVKYYGLQPRRVLVEEEKTKPNLPQVLSVYAWFVAELAILISAEFERSWRWAAPGLLIAGLPWILRKRATDRVKAEAIRKEMGFSPELSE